MIIIKPRSEKTTLTLLNMCNKEHILFDMKTLIISHANCVDGWVSAYLMSLVYPDNVIIYNQYHKELDFDYIKTLNIDSIRVVDFSLDFNVIKQLNEITQDIVIYDHHETSSRMYSGGMFCECEYKKEHSVLKNNCSVAYSVPNGSIFKALLVKDKCASMIIWEEYFKYSSSDHVSKMSESFYNNLKEVVQYVDDYDRWILSLTNVFEVNEIIRQIFSNNKNNSFNQLNNFIDQFDPNNFNTDLFCSDKDLCENINKALKIIKERDIIVNYLCDNPKIIRFEGYDVPFIQYDSRLVNYVGHKLREKYPFVFTYIIFPTESKVKVSLRSDRESPINLSTVAEKYGGGGHSSAASFTINIEQFSNLLK